MKSITIFLSFTLFISCKKEIDLLHRNDETKFVVWCYLHPDSIVTAYVSKTSPPLSIKADRIVTDALVVLYENNLPIDTLKNDSLTRYKSRKGFKPSVGNIYFMKISKPNFPTLETFPDTMPVKPILIKYIAEDSAAKISNSVYIARLRLYTDKPKYFEAYALSQGKYQYFNYLGVYGDATFNWKASENTCDLFYHSDINSHCGDNIPKDFYEYTGTIDGPKQFSGKKMSLSLYTMTKHGAEISSQPIGLIIPYSTIELDTYWTPVYSPETVKNGYGYLLCYNTLNFDVQF